MAEWPGPIGSIMHLNFSYDEAMTRADGQSRWWTLDHAGICWKISEPIQWLSTPSLLSSSSFLEAVAFDWRMQQGAPPPVHPTLWEQPQDLSLMHRSAVCRVLLGPQTSALMCQSIHPSSAGRLFAGQHPTPHFAICFFCSDLKVELQWMQTGEWYDDNNQQVPRMLEHPFWLLASGTPWLLWPSHALSSALFPIQTGISSVSQSNWPGEVG